jgi:hypothetical protein
VSNMTDEVKNDGAADKAAPDDKRAEKAVKDADAKRRETSESMSEAKAKRIEQEKKNEEAARVQADIDAKERAKDRADEYLANETIRRLAQEQIDRDKLRVPPPVTQATPPRVARPDEDTVRVVSPRAGFIWAEPTAAPDDKDAPPHAKKRLKVNINRGINHLPLSIARHPYLRDMGCDFLDDMPGDDTPKKLRKGPTVEEYRIAGYDPRGYPPKGCEDRSTPEEKEAAIKKWDEDHGK